MKHTPGPVAESEICGPYPICAVESDYETWYVNASGAVREEAGDDAEFIAWCYNNAPAIEAAPELLEACKKAMWFYDNWADLPNRKTEEMVDELQAAIAKAKGES